MTGRSDTKKKQLRVIRLTLLIIAVGAGVDGLLFNSWEVLVGTLIRLVLILYRLRLLFEN